MSVDVPVIHERAGALLDEINSAQVPARTVALWWLGQEGWIIRGGGVTIAIDAFLSDFGGYGRAYPPVLDPAALTNLDLVMGSHNHIDHIDPIGFPLMLQASSHAKGVVPAQVLDEVVGLDVAPDRLIGAVSDETIEHLGIRITPIPAVHADEPRKGYDFYLDDQGRHRFLGYVLDIDGVRICHLGDTLMYTGLAERLKSLELDLLMLPINGISWFREEKGFAGNMNSFEAAELAERSGARLNIPMHHDLFPANPELAGSFVSFAERFHPGAMILVPVLGKRIDIVGSH